MSEAGGESERRHEHKTTPVGETQTATHTGEMKKEKWRCIWCDARLRHKYTTAPQHQQHIEAASNNPAHSHRPETNKTTVGCRQGGRQEGYRERGCRKGIENERGRGHRQGARTASNVNQPVTNSHDLRQNGTPLRVALGVQVVRLVDE